MCTMYVHGIQSLIYGEVEFSSFYRVLRKINPAPGLVFYDLGSGTGKVLYIQCLQLQTVLTLVMHRYMCITVFRRCLRRGLRTILVSASASRFSPRYMHRRRPCWTGTACVVLCACA